MRVSAILPISQPVAPSPLPFVTFCYTTDRIKLVDYPTQTNVMCGVFPHEGAQIQDTLSVYPTQSDSPTHVTESHVYRPFTCRIKKHSQYKALLYYSLGGCLAPIAENRHIVTSLSVIS